ncbi:capsule-associated protein CAP1 [Puccinia graminis f. sp. tritici]|uniref:Capsule-associated protein CAP1 n=2 Tax=Puccinia graminis f. sp. tritici TaxID=56615 RepID=A0A5B0PFI0_PUCGR|nr:capsule-associated protein CAP1 [Puccinia graminis f. sp. tritici]
MSDIYLLSESSGSRKSSLVESLFKSDEPSTFPLSPKLRHDHLIGFSHRRLGSRGSSFSRVHSYLSQLANVEEEEKIATGLRVKTLRRRLRMPKYQALLLVVAGVLVYQCVFRSTPPKTTPSASPAAETTTPLVVLPMVSLDDPHPLRKIIQDAQESWKTIQKRQSKTYPEAVLEYQRRYKINPPNGFDKWFSFAKSHGHVLTDEYDSMMEQLSSFRKMDRNELHSRTNLIGKAQGFGLIVMKSGRINAQIPNNLSYSTYTNNDHENHEFNLQEGRIYTRWATSDKPAHKEIKQTQTWAFSKLIEKITRLDPTLFQDMSLAINEHFEPRVIIPWETKENSDEDLSQSWNHNRFEEHDNVWTSFRKACPPSSEARKQDDGLNFPDELFPRSSIEGKWEDGPQRAALEESLTASRSPLRFVTESPAPIKDIYCNQPQRHLEQGLFFSNTSKIEGLFPVFSQSTAQGFGDIVIPSYLYIRDPYKTREYANEPVSKRSRGTSFIAGGQASKMDPSLWKPWDVKWDQKKDQIYWRGLLRDGGDRPSGFQSNFGRHRLVKRFGSSVRSRSESLVWDTSPTKQSMFGSKDSGLNSLMGIGTPNPKMLSKQGLDRSFVNHKTMDVGYLAEDHCRAHEPCQELLKANYRLKMWEPFGAVKFFKWAIDIDGIGFSAKFLNLLQIGTAVVKQTVYREFYSDWMVPWVHYIPLSVEGDELYNIWNYFLGKDDGVFMEHQRHLAKEGWKIVNHEDTLKRIGHQASQWSQAHAREIDWEIYSYRLLLEWNRIWNSSE